MSEKLTKDALELRDADIFPLFRKYFIPTLIGMLSVCAVTAIDGIFVGHGVGPDGIAAINICVPIFMFVTGVGLMLGAGSAVVASIHLSHNKPKAARYHITQAFIAGSLIIILMTIPILTFPSATGRLFGSSPTLLPMVREYMLWFVPGEIFSMWGSLALFVIRLDGSPKYAAWCSAVMAIANTFLDWLFIFPFGWGLMGAGFASSISVSIGGIMALVYIIFFAKTLRFVRIKASWRSLRYSLRNVGYQCRVGSSGLLGECTMAVLAFIGNVVFGRYLGDAGIGAFGIACYYSPFVFMVGNAIAQSAQPIISYNYGLGNMQRVGNTLRIALGTAVGCGLIVMAAFIGIPDILVSLFVDPTTEAGRLAISGLPLFSAAFIFFIVNLTCIGYFQSIERVWHSTTFALLRGLVFLVPCFLLLPQWLGNTGIWLALTASELLTTTVIFSTVQIQKRIS